MNQSSLDTFYNELVKTLFHDVIFYIPSEIIPTGPVQGGTFDGCIGTITYTWNYADCAGNSNDWVYTFNIEDTTPPTLVTIDFNPSPDWLNCETEEAPSKPTLEFVDNCSTSVNVVEEETTTTDEILVNGVLTDFTTIVRTWTVSDDCGNTDIWTQTLECGIVRPCGAEDVVISKAVTANGDQWNEFFTITGVENCGFTVDVMIFNRWGSKIYESNNYQNDWNATAHSSSVGSSDKVPTGTYYYIVNLKNSGLKPFSGPIYVGTK